MARLYPPSPRIDLAKIPFALVTDLEAHLEDDFIVVQPRFRKAREFTIGDDPILVVHPTQGIAAILPHDDAHAAADLRFASGTISGDAITVFQGVVAARAGALLEINPRLILGLIYQPTGEHDPAIVVTGCAETLAGQVRLAMSRLHETPCRPSPEDLDRLRVRCLGGDRLVRSPISPKQQNYRDCRDLFESLRADHRDNGTTTSREGS